MMSIPASKRIHNDHVIEIMRYVERRLEELGYQPDSLMQIAGCLLVSHGVKVFDSYAGRRVELGPTLFDMYRSIVGNVIEHLIAYKHNQGPEGPEVKKNVSDEMIERAIEQLGRRV